MSRRVPDYFVLLDLECTGLDPQTDHILELGAILVRGQAPFAEIARANLILHPGADRTRLWGAMNPVVREMHEASGLWAETAGDNTWSLIDADKGIRDWLVEHTHGEPRPMICMAGTGVAAFDMQWVRAQMPQLASVLHYRALDTSPMHTLLALAGRDDLLEPFSSEPAHRALPDCERGLAELRLWTELLGQLP